MKTIFSAGLVFFGLTVIAMAEDIILLPAIPQPVVQEPALTVPAAPTPQLATNYNWIPKGKFGVIFDNGDRVIGVPSQDWSASVRTGFGQVTVPRNQLASMDVYVGEVQLHLNNGDRVSGTLLSKIMVFETKFGQMRIPAERIVNLGSHATPKHGTPQPTLDGLMPYLADDWSVTYTNKTQHTRKIGLNKLVDGSVQLVKQRRDILILFPNVIERITLVDDKLFVEHFNPRSTYPDGIPAVMGVGKRMSFR